MATIAVSLGPSLSDGLTKNFYCYAHGSPNTLCNAAGDVRITVPQVAALLGNGTGFPPGVMPRNPYRFVFLDACSTASDNQWRQAFGIMRFGPTDEAARPKLGAQALVGWTDLKADWMGGYYNQDGSLDVNKSESLQSAYTTTLQFFFFEWMNGQSLLTCIAEASNPTRTQCPLPAWTVTTITIKRPFTSSNFTDSNPYKGKIAIYGHPGLTRDGLNSDDDSLTWYDASGNRN